MFASWTNRQNGKKYKDSSHHLQFCGEKLIISRVQSELGTSVCIPIKSSKGLFQKMLQMTIFMVHKSQQTPRRVNEFFKRKVPCSLSMDLIFVERDELRSSNFTS